MDHIKNSSNGTDTAPPVTMTLLEPSDISAFSSWDVDFRQIEPGAMETKVTVRSGSTVSLMNISMSRAVHQTGVSPKGLLTFGLTRSNDLRTWQGQDTSTAELISFGSSDSFDGVSAARFCATAISIKEREVESLADALGLSVPTNLGASAKLSVIGQRRRLAAIRRNTEMLTGNCGSAMTSEVEEEIVAGLLLATNCDERCEDKSSASTRSRAVSQAIELMTSHLEESIPISRICRAAGVSWSTLDRAFSERFGVGPKRYYLNVRLNRARSDLIRKPRQGSVSDIANNWGFWHLGQFARDYYCMFNELPSDTVTAN